MRPSRALIIMHLSQLQLTSYENEPINLKLVFDGRYFVDKTINACEAAAIFAATGDLIRQLDTPDGYWTHPDIYIPTKYVVFAGAAFYFSPRPGEEGEILSAPGFIKGGFDWDASYNVEDWDDCPPDFPATLAAFLHQLHAINTQP